VVPGLIGVGSIIGGFIWEERSGFQGEESFTLPGKSRNFFEEVAPNREIVGSMGKMSP